jgi:hypothetical protein
MADTKYILEKITKFCDSIGLTVSSSKTKITNLQSSKALFLGVELSRSNIDKYARITSSSSLKRVGKGLRLTVSIERIINKLSSAGFIKMNKPAPKYLWMHNTHDQIISLYNSVFRGFINYYSFVHNYSRLISCLNFYLKQSCAKLLAAKYSLNSRAKVFNKYGRDLSSSKNGIKFISPSYITNMLNFKIKKNDKETNGTIKSLYALSKSKARLYNLACSACGSNRFVEMHHIRAMRDLNPKLSHIDQIMVRMNRRQIPLCRQCHVKRHAPNSVKKK